MGLCEGLPYFLPVKAGPLYLELVPREPRAVELVGASEARER